MKDHDPHALSFRVESLSRLSTLLAQSLLQCYSQGSMRIVHLQVWRVKYSLAKIRKASRELLTLDEKVRNF